MSTDEDFSRHLRERIDHVGPTIGVDTSTVIRRARHRRALTRTVSATAAVTMVAAVGWAAAAAQPWTRDTGQLPGGLAPVVTEAPPVPSPSAEPVVVGWPDAAYWHATYTTSYDGDVEQSEGWYGHTAPGLVVADGDLSTASGMGPALWGVLLIDGAWVQIHWDELYALPTDPVVLEALLRGSIEPDRGTGSEDDKVFGFAMDLLRNSPAPPPLRRALWTIAQGLPGSVLTPDQTDSTGRPSSLLVRVGDAESAGQYWFDPADGRLLEQDRRSYRFTFLDAGPATAPPIEPTLEGSGCVSWATC
jgi:hypothetical protein